MFFLFPLNMLPMRVLVSTPALSSARCQTEEEKNRTEAEEQMEEKGTLPEGRMLNISHDVVQGRLFK